MMGGSSKSEQFDPSINNIAPVTPPWLVGAQPLVLPQAAPGQLQALAAQFAQGGYGSPKANLAWMDRFYDPVNTQRLAPPPKIPVNPAPTTTAKNPLDDPNRMVLIDGKWKPAWQTSLVQRTGYPKGPPKR
jgi:hypothetical protein